MFRKKMRWKAQMMTRTRGDLSTRIAGSMITTKTPYDEQNMNCDFKSFHSERFF
jgi:hypothetical protein